MTKDGLPRVYDADAAGRPTVSCAATRTIPKRRRRSSPLCRSCSAKLDLKIKPVTLPVKRTSPMAGRSFPDDLDAQAKAPIEKAEAGSEEGERKAGAPTRHCRRGESEWRRPRPRFRRSKRAFKADQAAMATPVPDEYGATRGRGAQAGACGEFDCRPKPTSSRRNTNSNRRRATRRNSAAATTKLEAALKALKEPAEGYTPIGPRYPTTSSGTPARAGALDRVERQSAHCARCDQSHVAAPFRQAAGPDSIQLRTQRKTADSSGTAGLARGRVHGSQLGHEGDASADGDFEAYKMQSSGWKADSPQAKIDPDNTWLWHMNVRRLEAEAVRDSVLAIAGKLDSTMWRTGNRRNERSKRYSVAASTSGTAPDLQMDMLKVFDVASPNECFQRSESIVPQQALALANGKLSFTMARVAAQLSRAAAAALVTSRPMRSMQHPEGVLDRLRPTRRLKTGELAAKYLTAQAALYRDPGEVCSALKSDTESLIKPSGDPAQRARESLVHVLLNHNDFVTVR